jgi:lambda family phage portal protein
MAQMKLPRPTMLDRVIAYVSPAAGARRLEARAQIARYQAAVGIGGYHGGRRDRRALRDFNPGGGSADSQALPGLADLRDRSRDLVRNGGLAGPGLETLATKVIGSGLLLQARPDRARLGLSDEAADAWEAEAEALDAHFCTRCDIRGELHLGDLEYLAFFSVLDGGDAFVLLTWNEGPGDLFGLKLQLVEADLVSNPDRQPDRDGLVAGIERDPVGRPLAIHIASRYEFDTTIGATPLTWRRVPMRDAEGRPLVLHLKDVRRIGQSRGVPILAPVIELLQQITTMSQAELMAAVINSCFAVTTTTDDGTILSGGEQQAGLKTWDVGFTPGMVIEGLGPNEKVESFASQRPISGFEAFLNAFIRQIAVTLDLSIETLTRQFTASYSASRGALLETYAFIRRRRRWWVRNFRQPVYEAMLGEAVDRNYLSCPGWDNPLIRQAWCTADFTGPAPGQLDPVKEVEAAERRIALSASTETEVAAELTGGDWDRNITQRARERRRRETLNLPQVGEASAPLGHNGGPPLDQSADQPENDANASR